MNTLFRKYYSAPIGVIWFELRRSFSLSRILLWCMVAFFPMVLAAIVNYQSTTAPPQDRFVLILFFLVVRVASVMGLLLWATPVINGEIEGKTWLYVATRPHGGTGILIGKYAVALIWSLSAGLVAATTAVYASEIADAARVWWVLSVLTVLGCIAYGALFCLIGTMFQKRAMVLAIVYVVLVEGVLSTIPATISRFTIGYRLFALLVGWMGFDQGENSEALSFLVDDTSAAFHVAILLVITLVFMAAATLRVRFGGYLTETES